LKRAVTDAAGADAVAVAAAEKAVHVNRALRFNNLLDAAVSGAFLALGVIILLIALREWTLILMRRKLAQLRESEPVLLPAAAAVAPTASPGALGLLALLFTLAKELSGESAIERERQQLAVESCDCGRPTAARAYVAFTTRRFKGVNRCC
jgi:hypothetical protein